MWRALDSLRDQLNIKNMEVVVWLWHVCARGIAAIWGKVLFYMCSDVQIATVLACGDRKIYSVFILLCLVARAFPSESGYLSLIWGLLMHAFFVGYDKTNALPCAVGWGWFFSWWPPGTRAFPVVCVSVFLGKSFKLYYVITFPLV